jgi:hypothetical protein
VSRSHEKKGKGGGNKDRRGKGKDRGQVSGAQDSRKPTAPQGLAPPSAVLQVLSAAPAPPPPPWKEPAFQKGPVSFDVSSVTGPAGGSLAAVSSSSWQASPEPMAVHTSAAALQALLPDVQKAVPEACPATDVNALAVMLNRMINISGTVVTPEMASLLTQAMGQSASQQPTPSDAAKPVHSQMHDIARRLRRAQKALEELEASKVKQRELWLAYLTVVREHHAKQVSAFNTKMTSIEEAMQAAKVEESAAMTAMTAIQTVAQAAASVGEISSDDSMEDLAPSAKVAKVAAALNEDMEELLPDPSQDRRRSASLLAAAFAAASPPVMAEAVIPSAAGLTSPEEATDPAQSRGPAMAAFGKAAKPDRRGRTAEKQSPYTPDASRRSHSKQRKKNR